MATKAVWSGLLILAAAGVLPAAHSTIDYEDFQRSYALAPNGRVVIDNPYGDVRITGWDRNEVQIQAVKTSGMTGRLEDAAIIVDATDERVSVRTQYAGIDPREPASVEYRISVPRNANLEDIRLVNGALSIHGVAGPVKASSVNGNITAEALEGMADLATVNGEVAAGFEHLSASQPISLRSVNGHIVLSIPQGAGAQLLAQNRSGGIEADLGRRIRQTAGHRLETVLGGGGASIVLRNVTGGISIHSTWSRRQEKPGF
jgi:hypothetical protein